jgi:hypothetical protein
LDKINNKKKGVKKKLILTFKNLVIAFLNAGLLRPVGETRPAFPILKPFMEPCPGKWEAADFSKNGERVRRDFKMPEEKKRG